MVVFFFSSKVPFCVTTLGWGLAGGFTGLGVAARPAHLSQMGGFGRKGDRERTGRQGMAGRASGARCNVHGAMVVMGGGGGGRGAQEQQDEGCNGGGEQTMGVNLVLSCLSAPAPKPEPRAVIPVVKQSRGVSRDSGCGVSSCKPRGDFRFGWGRVAIVSWKLQFKRGLLHDQNQQHLLFGHQLSRNMELLLGSWAVILSQLDPTRLSDI